MNKTLQSKILFCVIALTVVVNFMSLNTPYLDIGVKSAAAATTLLVDFGMTEAENQYGLTGWETVIRDTYTNYVELGPGGTAITVGSNGSYDYQGITGSATTFQLGQAIVVTWYNNSTEMISFTPQISFDDSNRKGAAPAGTWKDMTLVNIAPNDTATSTFFFSVENQGSYFTVNVNVNYNNSRLLICDKIELDLDVDITAPSEPQNLQLDDSVSGEIRLSWDASTDNVGVAKYNVYRNGTLIESTAALNYIDASIVGGVYQYSVKATDAIGNVSSGTIVSVTLPILNTITLREKAGVTTSNYPITFGQVFQKGEMPESVAIEISGTEILTQTNVKRRYDDGSVRHAVISALIPTVQANQDVTLVLVPSASANTSGAMTQAEILATDVQSQIALSGLSGSGYSGDLTANLRDSISDSSNWEYWLKGVVVTEIIVNQTLNNSLNAVWEVRIYDMGNSDPADDKIRISNSIENVEAGYRGNINYAVEISQGNSSPQIVYTKPTFLHNHNARWRKVIWQSDDLPEVEMRYNVEYLKATGHIMNYDTSRQVSETAIQSVYDRWSSSDHDIMDASIIATFFGQTGGRPEIGLLPSWTTQYLFTMDNRLREEMLNLGELAGGIPVHYRESNATKSFYGRSVSINDRPTIDLKDMTHTSQTDMLPDAIGETTTEWSVDRAHQASFAYVPYLITGEKFYLDEMYYWSLFDLAFDNYERNGSDGLIYSQVRGEGWTIRVLGETASLAPDDDVEKTYIEEKIHNNINAWIAEEDRYPLNHWGANIDVRNAAAYYTDPDNVDAAIGPWQDDYMLICLTHIDELGYDTENIVNWYSAFHINRFTHPDFNPYNGPAVNYPVKISGNYVSGWKQLNDNLLAQPTEFTDGDYAYSYRMSSLAALSTVINRSALQSLESGGTNVATGQEAYDFLKANVKNQDSMNDDPRWAIIPRIRLNSVDCGDISGDQDTDLEDLILGLQVLVGKDISPNASADCNLDGKINMTELFSILEQLQ